MSVSVICACRDRIKPLTISLSSWLLFDQIKEIIIVDWSSKEEISHLTKLDDRIKVIRVDGEEYFNQPQPLNLAASMATGEFILKFDADHILNPYYNFFHVNGIFDDESFVSGVNDKVGDECLHPIWGLLYVRREHFEKVGGYNEKMGKYYAVEDDEISIRLQAAGYTCCPIDMRVLSAIHIPHNDEVRISNFEGYAKDREFLDVFEKQTGQWYKDRIDEVIAPGIMGILNSKELKKTKFKYLTEQHKEKNMEIFGLKEYIDKSRYDYGGIDFDQPNFRLYDWKTKEVEPNYFIATKKKK